MGRETIVSETIFDGRLYEIFHIGVAVAKLSMAVKSVFFCRPERINNIHINSLLHESTDPNEEAQRSEQIDPKLRIRQRLRR